ncbi:hypothetical protein BDV18DRAFT_118946 [Aspergillus unguis]
MILTHLKRVSTCFCSSKFFCVSKILLTLSSGSNYPGCLHVFSLAKRKAYFLLSTLALSCAWLCRSFLLYLLV